MGALAHYASVPGPQAAVASELHSRLRSAVLGNTLAEYARTGFLWEQYGGGGGGSVGGEGKGTRPFTGWTALVALVAAEEYGDFYA